MALNRKGIYLKNLVENHGSERVCAILDQAFQENEIKTTDFSIRELAEAFLGEDWVNDLDRVSRQSQGGYQPLLEADGAGVDSTSFANITGQIIYNAVLEGYNGVQYIGDQLVTTIPTPFHDGEKIAGVTAPRGVPLEVPEGMPYPEFGIQEDYIETPATQKFGFIISLTIETVAKDRTGVLLQRAQNVGDRVAYQKETRILDAFLDVNSTRYRYKWKGTTYATFLTSGNWINDKSSAPLTDWTSIEDVLVQAADVANPDQPDETEPMPFMPNAIMVMPFNQMTARRILTATEVRQVSNTNNTTLNANPVAGMFGDPLVSAIAYQRLIKSGLTATQAKHYWFIFERMKTHYYMQVVPLTVDQAAPNSTSAFERDVVLRWKARERGTPVVAQPRKVFRRYST